MTPITLGIVHRLFRRKGGGKGGRWGSRSGGKGKSSEHGGGTHTHSMNRYANYFTRSNKPQTQ